MTTTPAPTVTTITPTSGLRIGGTTLTITGTNLTEATVTIGGTVATAISVTPEGTTLTCKTPMDLTPGKVAVVVTTSSGSVTKATAFEYLNGWLVIACGNYDTTGPSREDYLRTYLGTYIQGAYPKGAGGAATFTESNGTQWRFPLLGPPTAPQTLSPVDGGPMGELHKKHEAAVTELEAAKAHIAQLKAEAEARRKT